MAVDAFFGYRFMNELFVLESLLLVRMARKTYLVSGGAQKFREIRLVGVVAHRAFACCNGPVDKLPRGELFVMAEETKVHPFGAKLIFERGLMRRVAFGTIAILHRFVDTLLGVYPVVALMAKICDILDRLEFVL